MILEGEVVWRERGGQGVSSQNRVATAVMGTDAAQGAGAGNKVLQMQAMLESLGEWHAYLGQVGSVYIEIRRMKA